MIRGAGQYSARDEIRVATGELIASQARELWSASGQKPRCGYAHGSQTECRDPDCQRWLDGVVAWPQRRVGGPHVDLTVWAAVWISNGRALGRDTTDDEWRREPVVLGEGPTVDGPWTTFEVHIHVSASRGDVHALIDRVWTRAHTRAGRLARPARAVYWRRLAANGWSHQRIADEWLTQTDRWASTPGVRPALSAVELPAYDELRGAAARRSQRKRVRTSDDGEHELVDTATVGWTLANLARLEAA